jgi:rSAM/selenodomain-associated transferase 2
VSVRTSVSVIIPSLNEAERIGAAVDSAFAAGAREVIVADGGSVDETAAVALAHGARVIGCERHRARQLNRGAAVATGEILLFLHADSILPAGSIEAVSDAARDGFVFGGFRIRFIERSFRLRYVETMINLRTRLTRAPWGDQGQFATREAFITTGGYPDFPLMEDYELARRMKRIGRTVLLPHYVRTSGRRFQLKGVIRTSVVNWLIVFAFHTGVSPERLARWYRG